MAANEMQFIICNAGVEAVTCQFKVADKSAMSTRAVPGSGDSQVKLASTSHANEPSPDANSKGTPMAAGAHSDSDDGFVAVPKAEASPAGPSGVQAAPLPRPNSTTAAEPGHDMNAGSDESGLSHTSATGAAVTLAVTVLPGRALEVPALELVSMETGGKPITRLLSPAAPSRPSAGGEAPPATCIVLTYQDQQWDAQPAVGPGEVERWCTCEWGVVVDQRLQAAITCWATTPATRRQAINFIASLCHDAATASGTALQAACTSLVRFTEALPWIDAGYYQQSDFVTSMAFMSGVQALHKRASADGDPVLAALLSHMLRRTGFSKEAHLEGLFLPLSKSENSAVTAAHATAETTAAPAPATEVSPARGNPALSASSPVPSASPAAAPTAPVVSLAALQSLLSQLQPPTDSSDRGWDLDLDLHGQELRGAGCIGTAIAIPRGTRVRLHNGMLQLPGSCRISVGPNTLLQLDNIDVIGADSGVQRPYEALLMVSGKGADLKMSVCRVSVSANAHSEVNHVVRGRLNCVLVTGGAAATLHQCTLGGEAHTGLLVTEPGSTAAATQCTAQQCSSAGFAASCGGSTKLSDCASSNNKGDGFCAAGRGSVMEVGPGCTADSNGSHGFLCSAASKMAVASGASSSSNGGCGFKADGEGSSLQLGEECRAHSNKGHGFCAALGASMRIDRRADATSNQQSGFCVDGSRSCLETGEQCSAMTSSSHGFLARGGGQLLVGIENESTCSAGCGFMSSGKGSLVKMSAGCAAFSNNSSGCGFAAKGKLVNGNDYREKGNGMSRSELVKEVVPYAALTIVSALLRILFTPKC